jgi:hypothetical protein
MKFDNAMRGSKYHGEDHYGNINHGIDGRHAGVDSDGIHYKPGNYSNLKPMSLQTIINQFYEFRISWRVSKAAVGKIFPELLGKMHTMATTNPKMRVSDFLHDNKKHIGSLYYARYLAYLDGDRDIVDGDSDDENYDTYFNRLRWERYDS